MTAPTDPQRLSIGLIVHNQTDVAADLIGLDASMRRLLVSPFRTLAVEVPIRMDDGRIEVYRGYRIQHNGARGPCKGGVRYHPDADEEEVLGLATSMTWKTALLEIPFGGAKAPDMNTNQQVMAWMLDEYSAKRGYTPAAVTGKPVSLGGSLGREEATGLGVTYIMEEYARDYDIPLSGGTVVIQGFGNVGAHLAKFLHERGAKVIAVNDVDGGLYNEDGLNVPELFVHSYKRRKPVAEFQGGDRIESDRIWNIPCDWLVPAAIGGVINREQNAETVPCKIVVEAANSPTTPVADKILEARSIPVVPDFLANAGGVVVSYFEWTQNLQQHPWTLDEVNQALHKRMRKAYQAVRNVVNEKGVSWRTAALAIAMERVAEAERLRGGF
jgi:glutamate dehydrogenase (NAD(P)+)